MGLYHSRLCPEGHAVESQYPDYFRYTWSIDYKFYRLVVDHVCEGSTMTSIVAFTFSARCYR